jgi:drug/metabolite transporter (DMT)-like permease
MNKELRWFVLIVLVMFVWGSFFPITKMVVTGTHPLLIAFLRYLFALLVLTPLFILELSRRSSPGLRDLLVLSLLGLVGITGFAVFIFYGIRLTSSAASSILVNTQPIFATLLAPLFLREVFSLRRAAGSIAGLFGLVLVVSGGDFSALSFSDSAFAGNMLNILASISLTLFYIFIGTYVHRYGSVIASYLTMLAGTLFLLPLALCTGSGLAQVMEIGPAEWSLILYLGIVATAMVYLVFNKAVAQLGVVPSVSMKFLIPVFGILLSILLLGEKVEAPSWIGMGIVLASILIIQGRFNGRHTAPVFTKD